MRDWQVFKKRQAAPTSRPIVGILQKGVFSVNRAAFDALGGPDSVELLFLPDEKIIGIRATTNGSDTSYPLRTASGKPDGAHYVSGIAFTKFWKIDTTERRRYSAYMEDGVLCVNLDTDQLEISLEDDPGDPSEEVATG
jgi:hypothetical protein